MKRRALVASLPAFGTIGGCVGMMATNTPEPIRRVALSDEPTVSDAAEMDVAVELTEDTITEAAPATLTVTVTNTGADRYLKEAHDGNRLFGDLNNNSSPAGTFLVPEGDVPFTAGDDSNPEPWSAPNRAADNFVLYPAELVQRGESVTERYALWDDAEQEGYFEPGAYTFRGEIAVHSDRLSFDRSFDVTFGLEVRE